MHATVELCRECAGWGKKTIYQQWDRLHQHPNDIVCELCEGSGRVVVSKKIEVKIEPFKNKTT